MAGGHGAALSTGCKEGFAAGVDHPRTFLLRGEKILQHLGCLPSGVRLW